MPKRKARKVTKQSTPSQLNNSKCNVDSAVPEDNTFPDQEVERQIAAIRMIRDVEMEGLFSDIRLLKSSISKEKLQTPLLQFFEENLPNLTISRTDVSEPIDVKWKGEDDGNDGISMNSADGGKMMSFYLKHMSLANPEFSTAFPSLGGFDFSSQTGRTSFIGADNLQMKDFVLGEPSDTQILGIDDSMKTPGVSSGRMSVGMTPKTLRLPKQGCFCLFMVHPSAFTRKTTWMQYTRQRKNELFVAGCFAS